MLLVSITTWPPLLLAVLAATTFGALIGLAVFEEFYHD